jgi:5-methylcytosine-specific restriction endonuclease McrA
MLPVMTISTIQERVSRLAGLLAREREALALFMSELAGFDAERCWESLGYPSLFEFLTRELRLSRSAAFYRTKAVGLVQRYPGVLDAIREGKLYINSVAALARVVTPENIAETLPRFFYLSREDAKMLSVELSPREVVPVREVVRVITPERPAVAPAEAPLPLLSQPIRSGLAPVRPANADDPKALDRTGQRPSAPLRAETVEPLTGQLTRISLTVSRELQAKIKAAQLALSHAHPGATIADLLELGVETALAQDAKRKGLVQKPRPRRANAQPTDSSHTPAEIRRAVWGRDHGCCQWKFPNGEICGSRYRLQYDHIKPRAKGGETTIANVRLLCQRHNLLAARQAFGEQLMRSYRRGIVGPPAALSGRSGSSPESFSPRPPGGDSSASAGPPAG